MVSLSPAMDIMTDLISLNNKVNKRMEREVKQFEALDRLRHELASVSRTRRSRVTEQVNFHMENFWSLKEQEEMLQKVRRYQIEPPDGMTDEDVVTIHMQIDWPIMERLLAANLSLDPEERKQPKCSGKDLTRQKIKSDIERCMGIHVQEEFMKRVKQQMDGTLPLDDNAWWTKDDLPIILEELEKNLALELPKEAPLHVQQAEALKLHRDLFSRLSLSCQRVLQKRIRHYLQTRQDMCGDIAFLKHHSWAGDDQKIEFFVKAMEDNLLQEKPIFSNESDPCTVACKITSFVMRKGLWTQK